MNLREEKILWKKGFKLVVGIDEAGRGPLAGPVVAGALAVDKTFEKEILNKFAGVRDSKKLSAKKREKLYGLLTKNPSIRWGIGIVSEKIIDKINIKNAAELAMERALKNLEKKSKIKADYLIIDGNQMKNKTLNSFDHSLIVKADQKVFSCSAASIIAKVARDDIMEQYHKEYPKYRFDKHKGYGTKLHLILLAKFLPSAAHRKSFAPVKNLLK